MKSEYHKGAEARKNFEETMQRLFRRMPISRRDFGTKVYGSRTPRGAPGLDSETWELLTLIFTCQEGVLPFFF